MTEIEKKIDNIERRQNYLMLMSVIGVMLGLVKLYLQTN